MAGSEDKALTIAGLGEASEIGAAVEGPKAANLEAVKEALIEALLAFHESIRVIARPLTDQEIDTLIVEYKRDALPNDTHNFPIPDYEWIADRLHHEKVSAHVFRRAVEHMETTGESYYCVACDGTCKGHD